MIQEPPPGPDSPPASRRRRISATLRRAPLGVLLMAAVFAMIAVTSMAGGTYLAFIGQSENRWVGVAAVAAGPAILYLCYHLVRLTRWVWTSLVALIALLFVSSVVRVAVSPGIEMAALAEIAIELGLMFYLTRPGLRRAFGRGG